MNRGTDVWESLYSPRWRHRKGIGFTLAKNLGCLNRGMGAWGRSKHGMIQRSQDA